MRTPDQRPEPLQPVPENFSIRETSTTGGRGALRLLRTSLRKRWVSGDLQDKIVTMLADLLQDPSKKMRLAAAKTLIAAAAQDLKADQAEALAERMEQNLSLGTLREALTTAEGSATLRELGNRLSQELERRQVWDDGSTGPPPGTLSGPPGSLPLPDGKRPSQ
jgi:hypothetical protein